MHELKLIRKYLFPPFLKGGGGDLTRVAHQIALYPPLRKGDFLTPLIYGQALKVVVASKVTVQVRNVNQIQFRARGAPRVNDD